MRAAPSALLLCAAALLALASTPQAFAEDAEETVLAVSDFLWDLDGWTTSGTCENFQHGQKMIKASDTGPATWYFVAPSKFLDAKRAAYGGKLSFRHGFFEYNRCRTAPDLHNMSSPFCRVTCAAQCCGAVPPGDICSGR